jgi:glycosyltransferase involved in cell wall biosynthesis
MIVPDRPLRVLFDARAITPRRSGIGEYSIHLCRALLAHHADEIALHLYDGRRAHAVGSADEIDEAVHAIRDGDLYRYGMHLGIGAAARGAAVDLYHFPDFFAPLHPIGVPMVLTIHDVVPLAHPEYLGRSKKARLRGVFRVWARTAARRARLVLTDSEFSRGEILTHLALDASHVRTVHLASAAERSDAPFDAQLAGGMRAGGYLLYVGRHDPYKGLPLLLAAFARARAAGSLGDVGLVITGSLDIRYDARALVAAHGLEDAVVCTDYVTREELGALYRHARALVLPSLYEGFGLPPLDAMLHDVPVLCSNRGSLPEITGDAALVCDPEDTEAFRNALVTIAEDDTFRRICIERGRRRKDSFSWRATARLTMTAYRDALAGRH